MVGEKPQSVLGHVGKEFKKREMTNIHSAIKQFEQVAGKGQVLAGYLIGGAQKHVLGYKGNKEYSDVDIYLITKDNLYDSRGKTSPLIHKLREEINIHLGDIPIERITGNKFPAHNDLDQLASHQAIVKGIPIYNKEIARELQKKALKQMQEAFGDKYDSKIKEIRTHTRKKIPVIY